MKKLALFLTLFFGSIAAAQVPVVGSPQDSGASLPQTCTLGQGTFFKTSAADGHGAAGIYYCANPSGVYPANWSQLASGSLSGSQFQGLGIGGSGTAVALSLPDYYASLANPPIVADNSTDQCANWATLWLHSRLVVQSFTCRLAPAQRCSRLAI